MYTILTRILVFLCLAAVLAGTFFWYTPLIKRNEEMQRNLLRTEATLEKEHQRYQKLNTELALLQNSPREVEKLIREGYRYSRPKETIFIFEPVTRSSKSE